MSKRCVVAVLVSATVAFGPATAKQVLSVENKPTLVLQRVDIAKTPYQLGLGVGEMAPNTMKARRIQTGPEVVYVLEGELILTEDGQAPKTIKAGESFQIAKGSVHETQAGPQGAKFVASWLWEPTKPFVVPAPK